MKHFYTLIVSLLLFCFNTNAQVTLSQTTNDIIVPEAGIGCYHYPSTPGVLPVVLDNEFMRAFDLNSLGYSNFEVTSVNFGIELVVNESTGFAVEAVIYGATSFPSGTLTEIQSVSVPLVSSDSGTIKSVSINANIDAATYPIMVIAIKVQNQYVLGNSTGFFIGANQNGETAPSYLIAPDVCNINVPTTLISEGYTSHYIIKVTGIPTMATVLDVDSNTIEGFTSYPNPVKDTLFLNAQDAIQEVSVYNVLGQRVLQVVPNVLNTSIPLTGVEAGMYIVKVKVGNKTATYKVVKE